MSRFIRIPRALRGARGTYFALVVLGSIPVIVLAAFAYVVSARAVESFVHRGNEAAATITAAMVEREFEHWTATLTSHAGFPTLSAATVVGDTAAVRQRLAIFVSAHDRLDRAFVTDTTGLLWADYPVAPESLNRRFDHRDWFRGVREAARSGQAYVSEVYRRNARPRILVVAVAAPIRAPASGELAGFLVAQVRLDELAGLLGRVEVGDGGIVALRDHTGVLAAHPDLEIDGPPRDEYADVRFSGGGARGASRARYADPLSDDTVLATAVRARVGSHEWTVISQQPLDVAFAPARDLAARLGGAGIVTAGLMVILLWGVAREYGRRRKAEGDLIALNEQLEQRVAERTTALREKEGQLVQAQKMEAVGRLAGGVAHDFNNLLTVILGSTDLLLLDLADDASERREVEQVREAAERATTLTRQLLAFSRKQVMEPKIIDVNESVESMRGILERVIGEDVDLVCRLEGDLHPVKFDPGQIEQVIMNLAVNARDAMPHGGRLTIETANAELDDDYVEEHVDAEPGPHVMLAVTDTGCGMDAATRQKIFEPFFTTKKPGQG
ncbi:MAG: sensor histidine kinase, partial [Gemmatimonadota bacterium]